MNQGGGKGVTGADRVFNVDSKSWVFVRSVSIKEQTALGAAGNAN